MLQDGSLFFTSHTVFTKKTEKEQFLKNPREIYQFTNLQIYQEIYKHKNLGLKFYAHTQISEGHIFTG